MFDVSKIKITDTSHFVKLNDFKGTVLNQAYDKLFKLVVLKSSQIAYWDVVDNIIELSHALKRYSYQWDYPINLILRKGDNVMKNTKLIKTEYLYRYRLDNDPEKINREIALKNIKTVINSIDKAFTESELIGQTIIGYRGMTKHFEELQEFPQLKPIGTSFVSKCYTSISVRKGIASSFANKNCCIYKIVVDENVPVIDMVNTTQYQYEKEILLPRNLLFKYAGKDSGYDSDCFILHVSLVDPSMYSNNKPSKKCKRQKLAILQPITSQSTIDTIIKEPTNTKEPITGAPKCPINTHRNANSGMCVPTELLPPPNKVKSPVKPIFSALPPTPVCPPNWKLSKSSCVCIPQSPNKTLKSKSKKKSPNKIQKSKSKKKSPNKNPVLIKPCPQGKKRNPNTNRCIKLETYIKKVKSGEILYDF